MVINLGEVNDFNNSIPALELFYEDDFSLSLIPRKTYPGGAILKDNADAEIAYKPCYYVQSVPIWDADWASHRPEYQWEYVSQKIRTSIRKLRGNLKRSLFRPLYGRSVPAPNIDPPNGFSISTGTAHEIVSYEEIMRSESFDSISVTKTQNRPDGIFSRPAHRTDKIEPTAFTERLWREHLEGIKPVGAYLPPDQQPEPPYDRKYAFAHPDMFCAIRDYVILQRDSSDPGHELGLLADRGLDAGHYQTLMYQSVPMIVEPAIHVPAPDNHQIYTIDFQMLTLRPHECFNVKITDWNRMPQQLGSYCVIVFFGNLTFQSLDSHGLLSGLDPTTT